jgi:hypothetical protein
MQIVADILTDNWPVWKVCIAQPRYRPHNVDAFYIFTIKFSKSQPHNFQTFQSGQLAYLHISAIAVLQQICDRYLQTFMHVSLVREWTECV